MTKVLKFLQQASYSKRRLVEMMLIVLIISLGVSAFSSFVFRQKHHNDERFFENILYQEHVDVSEKLAELLDQPDFSFEGLTHLIPLLAGFDEERLQERIFRVLEASHFSDIEKVLCKAALRTWFDGTTPDVVLVSKALENPSVRYANRLLGDFWSQKGRLKEAVDCYKKEASFEGAEVSRHRLLDLLIKQELFEDVKELRSEPFFDRVFDPYLLRTLAIKERRLGALFRWSFLAEYSHLHWGLVALATFSALLWFALCMKLGQINPLDLRSVSLCLLATFLGMLSAHVTLVVSIIQHEWFGFVMQTELISGLIYAVVGIGLREELIKLLFVLPLVPYLVKRGSLLDWLIVPAFVGLGFAAEENISYFHQSNSVAAIGRFLTANFFHISATALTGQALCRLWKSPRRQGDNFLTLFVMVVVIHGLYDALLMIPSLIQYSLFSFTAYIFLCYQFFGELHPLRSRGTDRFSLTSMFLFAVSLLFGVTLAYLGTFLGIRSAIILLFPVIIELAVLVYMFVREFKETIR